MFREGTKGFEGPFQLSKVDGKTVYVTDSEDIIKIFSRGQIEHYREATEMERWSTSFLRNISRGIREEVHATKITEIIQQDGVRAEDPRMTDPKRKEIRGLLDRRTFKKIMRSENKQAQTYWVADTYYQSKTLVQIEKYGKQDMSYMVIGTTKRRSW